MTELIFFHNFSWFEFGGGWWIVGVVRLSFFILRDFENARGEIKNQTENFFSTTPDRIEDDIGDEERDGEGA